MMDAALVNETNDLAAQVGGEGKGRLEGRPDQANALFVFRVYFIGFGPWFLG